MRFKAWLEDGVCWLRCPNPDGFFDCMHAVATRASGGRYGFVACSVTYFILNCVVMGHVLAVYMLWLGSDYCCIMY